MVRYKDKIHQFFHHARIGDPYLGPIHKEATRYEITDHGNSTEDEAADQLALQIRNSLVITDTEQPGSATETREPWAPERTPKIPSATYLAQQEQPKLQMATETIARTFTETTTQPDIAQQLSQPPEESMRGAGGPRESFPLGTNRLNVKEARV